MNSLNRPQPFRAQVTENADLASALSETRQKLESEVRVRENRDARLLLDTQVKIDVFAALKKLKYN
jgi:hypothetical protein